MAFENVNFDFIKDQEGFETSGYVPKDREGNILGQSGVTIASGFDLGQRNINDLKGLPEELIAKLSDYVGLKGEAADNAAKKLNITKEEGEIINQFAKQKTLNKLASDWEAKTGQDFNLLPENKATAIASVAFQYGDLEKKTPNFWNQVTSNDWEGAKKNLASFGDKYGERRNRELDYLNKEEKQTTNPFDYFKALQAAGQEEQMINPALFGQRREEERAKGLEQLIEQKLRDSGNTPMMNTEYNQMPMQPQAEGLAALGRGGDSMMVHMQPEEVAGLQQLARANGTSMTVNPMTGQMEAFSLGGLFRAAVPMAVGAMMPGVGTALAAGALTGGAMAAMSGQNPLMGAISGGMGGYGGFNLGAGLGSFGAGQAGTTAATNAARFGGAFGSGAMGAQQAAQAGYSGALSGMTAGAGGAGAGMQAGYTGSLGAFGAPQAAMQGASAAGALGANTFNYGDLTAPAKIDSIKQGFNAAIDNPQGFLTSYGEGSALGGGLKLAGNVGTVASGGLEESDLYPVMTGVKDPRDVYDPNSRLNLSMDTGINEALKKDSGLRLYAEGGTVQPEVMRNIGAGYGGGGGSGNMGLRALLNGSMPNMQTTGVPEGMPIADLIRARRGYMPGPKGRQQLAEGGYLNGEGDGMSDDISALIDGEQEAALSDGEFVIPADVVSHIGNGSSEAGASALYNMMDKIRQARTGSTEQAPEIDAERYMPA
jgi:hypothetical protein